MRTFFLLCLLLFLAACSSSEAAPAGVRERVAAWWGNGATATPDGGLVLSALTPVSGSPTPVLSRLTPVVVSPLPLVDGELVVSGEVVGPSRVSEVSEWFVGVVRGEAVVAQVADSDRINAALEQADLLRGRARWWWEDLNGDGRYEWLLRLKLPGLEESLPWGSPAQIWVADSVEGVVYEVVSKEVEGLELLLLDDFTGDGLPEALYQVTSCGTHTCYQVYYLISYQQSDSLTELPFVLAEGSQKRFKFVNMPSSEWVVEDWSGDGLPDLLLHGGMIGSGAAGVQRARREVYSWDGEAMRLLDVTFEPSDWRYFRLLDANQALALGDHELALALYDEAIVSEELKDSPWPAKNSARSERVAIEQYAGFRLLFTLLIQGDTDGANMRLKWLVRTYPDAPMSEAAQLLYDQYMKNKDLVAACAAATEYALTVADITSPLDDRGYANPALTANTLCSIDQ